MKNFIYNAAVIRFRPYRDTGEFVNIGIIVHFPQVGCTQLKLQTKTKRITDFFPEIERKLILDTYTYIKDEIASTFPVQHSFPEVPSFDFFTERDNGIFQHFISLREGLIMFSDPISGVAVNIQTKCEELFSYYVKRNFAETKITPEKRLENQFSKTLTAWNFRNKFQPGFLGNDIYHFRVPFQHRNLSIRTIILNREITEIYDYWDTWNSRINRLRTIAGINANILFPVQLPKNGTKEFSVAMETVNEWNKNPGITACPVDDLDQIKHRINNAIS